MRHNFDNREELTKAIDNSVVGYKSTRNRAILKDHYIDGMTFEEVAEKYGLSVRHTKQIAHDYISIIYKNLE
jgi:DNA-directed RNA polymerase specialized sigma subunit